MHFDKFSFGALRIDGSTYEQDVVIDCGEIRKRKKALPIDSVTSLDIRPCPSKRGYPENATDL